MRLNLYNNSEWSIFRSFHTNRLFINLGRVQIIVSLP